MKSCGACTCLPIRRFVGPLLAQLVLGLAGLLFVASWPGCAHAGPHEVRQGETLKSIAASNNISVKDLAQANGLAANSRLKKGQVLQVPDRPALLRPDITVPGENLKALTEPRSQGYSKIEPPAQQSPGKPARRGVTIAPEFRPAVEAVTPQSPVAREPKTYDRSAPGVTAVIHQDDKTEIRGVFNLPGSAPGASHQGGRTDHEAGSSPAAGVLLRRSF